MDEFNPNEILNRQFSDEETALSDAIAGQAQAIQGHRRRLLEGMNTEYQIERKYIEQTPMDDEQRNAQVMRLNQKYELKIAKLDQELEPHVLQLRQAEATGKSKLVARRMDANHRLSVVQDLMDKDLIPKQNRAAVLQEQLKAVGVSVPLAIFKQPKQETPMDRLKAVRSELEYVNAAVSPFVPKKDNGEMFNKDGTLRKDVQYVEVEGTKGRTLTQAEREKANELFSHQRYLQGERNRILGEMQTGRLTRAVATAGNQQSTPFSVGVQQQVQPKKTPTTAPASKGKPSVELVNQLKTQGLNRMQATQWLKENGYDVGS